MWFIDLLVLFVSLLVMVIFIMIGVAFLTLMERKVLGYVHIRKGPNKVGFMGIVQPFSDALKLMSKENIIPLMSNKALYYFSPVFNLTLSFLMWLVIPFFTMFISFSFGLLYMLCLSSMIVYSVMISGWSSNSSYSLIGSLRSVAQLISYEVSFFLILMSFLVLMGSLSFYDFFYYQGYVWFVYMSLPLSMCWFGSMMAETNRTPFDFSECESELVSGFNVEYGSGGFLLIFLSEYMNIIFMSYIYSIIFLGGNLSSMIFFVNVVFISFMFILVRGVLPRMRYDKQMDLCWKVYLPVSLGYLFMFFCFKVLSMVLLI